MTSPPAPPRPSRLPRLALVGFVVLLGLSVAIALVIAGSRAAERALPPPPVIAALPDFALVDSGGREVTRAGLLGRPWVADMIFTRCPFSCPRMTEQMRALGPGLERAGGARRVSLSVDPEYDTPEVLAGYREERGIDDAEWIFLTGGRDEIVELVFGGFRLGLDLTPPSGAAEPILHSTRFVLVDADGRIRGYYDAFQPGERERLLRELAALHREPPAGAESRSLPPGSATVFG